MQDLKELFETNLDNYDIGAVVDKAHCFINRSKLFHQMKINNIDFYNDTFGDKISLNKVLSNKGKKFNNIYNSHHLVYQNGVMLLNLNSYANSFKKLVQDYKTISQMSFGDLNMMNVYCKILELPGKYNCYSISKNSDKVVIFHCCTSICVCGFSSLFYTLKYFNLADVLVDNKMLF
jgi:lipopolysaccharide biosynthesis glycosyltransferase